jgi:WD40 repeat protein
MSLHSSKQASHGNSYSVKDTHTNVFVVFFALSQVVNHVYFSPDGQWLASASFDKSVKLWNGITGKFVSAFRGHVADVYQIRSAAFSLHPVSHRFHT